MKKRNSSDKKRHRSSEQTASGFIQELNGNNESIVESHFAW